MLFPRMVKWGKGEQADILRLKQQIMLIIVKPVELCVCVCVRMRQI